MTYTGNGLTQAEQETADMALPHPDLYYKKKTGGNKMTEATFRVGGRYLIRKTYSYHNDVEEICIAEISPSGIWVKVKATNCWVDQRDYKIVEVLK